MSVNLNITGVFSHLAIKDIIYTLWSLYYVNLSNYLLWQISNQPITWDQLNAFMDLDMVKMI